MNNLTTRKIVLGLLMTLVLAFGVQGIADALTFRPHTSSDGDLQTVVVNNEFTISFSVSLGSNTTRITDDNGKLTKDSTTEGGDSARIDSSGYLVVEIDGRDYRTITGTPEGDLVVDPRPQYSTNSGGTLADPAEAGSPDSSAYYVDSSGNVVDADGEAVYVRRGRGIRANNSDPNNPITANPWTYTRAKADPNDKVDDQFRYHFNEESISILAPTNVDLRKVGSHNVNVEGPTAHTMDEMKNSVDDKKLTSSIRLTYFVDTVGKYTITITDKTPASDRPRDEPPLSFTIFVVPSLDNTTDLRFQGDGTDGYETRNDNAPPQVNVLFGDGAAFDTGDNVPLVYSVEGSGRLYVEEIYGDGSPVSQSRSTQTLSTSSQAGVYLDMNGSSNKVTAYVRDRNAVETSRTITFIFNYAEIEIISGNDQTGVPNSRLIDPLGIRVRDAKGRALSGLAVTFNPEDGATLKPVIGTDVYLAGSEWASTFGTITRTKAATSTVPPDIDEDDAAMVPTDRSGEAQVYVELGDDGAKTVTVTVGDATKTFNLTSAVTTDVPSIEILSGNNQRSADSGKVEDPLGCSGTSQQQPAFSDTVSYLHHNEGVFNNPRAISR